MAIALNLALCFKPLTCKIQASISLSARRKTETTDTNKTKNTYSFAVFQFLVNSFSHFGHCIIILSAISILIKFSRRKGSEKAIKYTVLSCYDLLDDRLFPKHHSTNAQITPRHSKSLHFKDTSLPPGSWPNPNCINNSAT